MLFRSVSQSRYERQNQASTSTYTDSYDIQVFGTFGNTANTWFSGLYRDHLASQSHYTRNVWKLYAANNVNILTTSSNNVDSSSIYYHLGTLQSYLEPYGSSGAFVANASGVSLAASASYPVTISANSLSLATSL